ncbi:unnamed protein product [Hymenolepis diminuta]|uniref:DUF4209 domain-containing protein n=1 Tax=Hymenolepis diminuta TaxID=6216 RepID=A0A564Z9Z2_HYMDI|nr:unnamed protein product [Hymenolepis diminuta]
MSSEFYPDSFLSPRAKELFLACGKVRDSAEESNCPCVTCDGFIVMEHIAAHLEDFVEKEDYLSAIQSIAHTMQFCQRNFYIDAFHYNPHCLKWLNMPLHFVRLRNSSKNHTSLDRLLGMLQVTSMLEFSLSRLLTDENGRSPNHLSATLEDNRLAKFLNPPTRSVLKVLFGPVTSLNLRNILWHGFASPHDVETLIPECILYFLFAVVLAIDEQLTGIIVSHSIGESKLSQCFEILTKEILLQGSYVSVPKEPEDINAVFLKPFVELISKRRYFDANCIGVLCIISVLRSEYCRAIKWPEGVLTSEDRFFLTLNGILKMHFYKTNHRSATIEEWQQFAQRVGSVNLLLLGAVFAAEDGPRLRERIAHGQLFETSITDSPLWEKIARRLEFCVYLLLNHIRFGRTALALGDLDVRPDALNPLARYATAACGLWTTWAAFYCMYSELSPVHRPRSAYIIAARKWFPQLPDFDKINLHSLYEGAEFLPSVDISRLWIWKAHYVKKFKGPPVENQSLSECRYEDKRNPLKTAQWLARVVKSLDACLKAYFDQYSSYSTMDKYWFKPNKVEDVERFCEVIIPSLLSVMSIPVLCCCIKECIWKTWFSGTFLANECDEIDDSSVPRDAHLLINSFETWESKITSALKTKENARIEKMLTSLWIAHPESRET